MRAQVNKGRYPAVVVEAKLIQKRKLRIRLEKRACCDLSMGATGQGQGKAKNTMHHDLCTKTLKF